MRTHYLNLQVIEEAGAEVIRASYKALAQKWHPDRNPDKVEEAESVFKIITSAYEVLSDPTERAKYDALLKERRKASMPRPGAPSPQPAKAACRTSNGYANSGVPPGPEQTSFGTPKDPHQTPPHSWDEYPILKQVMNPPRILVIAIFVTAWFFVFGKHWTIETLIRQLFLQ